MARDRSAKGRQRTHGLCVGTGVQFQPLPLEFLRSRACAEMSPHAAKLLLDVLGLMNANGRGNGDIGLTFSRMRPRGWNSKSTLDLAIRELIDSGLLIQTRQGGRKLCALYAFTCYALDCDLSKLDASPDCIAKARMATDPAMNRSPTDTHPAQWRRIRKRDP